MLFVHDGKALGDNLVAKKAAGVVVLFVVMGVEVREVRSNFTSDGLHT